MNEKAQSESEVKARRAEEEARRVSDEQESVLKLAGVYKNGVY